MLQGMAIHVCEVALCQTTRHLPQAATHSPWAYTGNGCFTQVSKDEPNAQSICVDSSEDSNNRSYGDNRTGYVHRIEQGVAACFCPTGDFKGLSIIANSRSRSPR